MTHDEMIAVIQAAKEGKKIESKPKFKFNSDWGFSVHPGFNFNAYDYRVKPEPQVLHCIVMESGDIWAQYQTESMAKEVVSKGKLGLTYKKFVEVVD